MFILFIILNECRKIIYVLHIHLLYIYLLWFEDRFKVKMYSIEPREKKLFSIL